MTDKAEQQAQRRGVMDRIAGSWRAPRAEMRRLLADRPSESALLSFLMLAAFLGFVGRFVDHAAQPWSPNDPAFVAAWEERYREAAAADPAITPKDPAALSTQLRARALGAALNDKLTRDRFEMLIGNFLIFPLGVYLLSGLAAPVLRWFGGVGGGYGTRAAFAWAAVVTAPLGLLAQLALAFGRPSASVEAGAGLVVAAALLFFVASFLAEAHKFRSAASILGGLLGFLALLGLILLALQAVLV